MDTRQCCIDLDDDDDVCVCVCALTVVVVTYLKNVRLVVVKPSNCQKTCYNSILFSFIEVCMHVGCMHPFLDVWYGTPFMKGVLY